MSLREALDHERRQLDVEKERRLVESEREAKRRLGLDKEKAANKQAFHDFLQKTGFKDVLQELVALENLLDAQIQEKSLNDTSSKMQLELKWPVLLANEVPTVGGFMKVPSQKGYRKVIIDWNYFNAYWVRGKECVLDSFEKPVEEITKEDVVKAVAKAYCNPYWESDIIKMLAAEGGLIGKST